MAGLEDEDKEFLWEAGGVVVEQGGLEVVIVQVFEFKWRCNF